MSFLRRYIKGFIMSFGMFCAIPVPFHEWDDECTVLVIPCMPMVGGVIGLIWFASAELLCMSGIHAMMAAAILSLAPFILTGFLHLDGYMDTSDAILSRRPREKKLSILKDPHIGAFAAVMLGVLFLLQFAALYAIIDKTERFTQFLFIPIVSRCCTALSILCLPAMPESSYANMFKRNAKTRHAIFVLVIAIAAVLISCTLEWPNGLIIVSSVVLGFVAAMSCAFREFCGVSGDLAGFALVTGELTGLITWSQI